METLLEILKYTIPAILSLAAVYVIINRFLDNEDRRRNYEIRKATVAQITPIRLTAYERLVLFLERTAPESLVLRVQSPGMTNLQLQSALLETIRQEYEHNFSQQLYVSSKAAAIVRNAKESLIQLVNLSSSKVDSLASSTQLSVLILETYYSVEEPPSKIAIDFLKKELNNYFG